MSNEVEEPHTANSLSSRASGTEHPSSPTPNVRKKGRKYGSDLTDSAKKRKRQEHNKKGNERKKKEKYASLAKIAELEGRIASLSGWATEKIVIVMSSKVEAAEAATKIAQQKQSEAEELSTEKGFHQALWRERQKPEDNQWPSRLYLFLVVDGGCLLLFVFVCCFEQFCCFIIIMTVSHRNTASPS